MDIHISKESEVPLHEQVAAQLVFLIGTGRLAPGSPLPSVRALARRLGIHRNTISKAYHDLTLNQLTEKRAGRQLVVRVSEPEIPAGTEDLDALVDAAVVGARRGGYSLQQLFERVRERLRAAPPDHLLVLSADTGMRMLLPAELKQRLDCPVKACTPGELLSNPELAIGAVVVTPQGHIHRARSVLATHPATVAITYSPSDEQLRAIRRLKTPSLIAVVSVSEYFLTMARRVLAPALGRRHSIRSYLMAADRTDSVGAADVLLCDCMTYPVVRPRYEAATVLIYRLISEPCLDQISSMTKGSSRNCA